ncbi:MAG TPA: PfkB family carbohydrate kinase [Burkholderiaceae bacterium]|jgi:fructokinase
MISPMHSAKSEDNATRQCTSRPAELVIFGETLIDDFPAARVIGGAPFNVARTLAALGCPPLLISRVGQDDAAFEVIAELRKFGLDETGLQIDRNHTTGLVKVEMTGSSHQFNILPDQAYDYIDVERARVTVSEVFQGKPPRCIYFGTLAQRHQTSRACLRALLANTDALTFLDLNLRDGQFTSAIISDSLGLADIVKLNEDELRLVLRPTKLCFGDLPIEPSDDASRAELQSALQGLARLFSLQAIIVTLGERGYVYLDRAGNMYHGAASSASIEVVDTVGCGDAFSAIFLAGLLKGWATEMALERAHAFAASICTLRGAVAPDLAFYQTWLRQWDQDKEPE